MLLIMSILQKDIIVQRAPEQLRLACQDSRPVEQHDQMSTENRQWSARVTRESHALELESGVFTWDDPRLIAESLQRSAEASRRRKTTAFRSAMSMLVFYINRAGSNLDSDRKRVLEQAKEELRRLYGREQSRSGSHGSQRL